MNTTADCLFSYGYRLDSSAEMADLGYEEYFMMVV